MARAKVSSVLYSLFILYLLYLYEYYVDLLENLLFEHIDILHINGMQSWYCRVSEIKDKNNSFRVIS